MNGDERTQLEVVLAEVRTVSAQVGILVERDARDREVMKDHEVRLRRSEKWRYSLPAALIIAVVTSAATIVAAVLR